MPLPLIPLIPLLVAALAAALAPTRAAAIRRALVGTVLAGATAPAFAVAGDPLALVVALLTAFVAAVVLDFARRHLRADARAQAFAVRVPLLAASVFGFAGARDLVTFGLCWVASGGLLVLLIGHVRDWDEARAAARRAGMSFAIGDAALLAALALLGWYADTGDLAAALAATPAMPPLLATAIAALLLVAAAVRCGLPPFSRWLRRSMAAPTPVSALMHAGLVNAGGVLLIRFAPVLEAAPAIRWAAIALGAAAALFGTGVMLVRPDVKRGLAGSTVAQMGFMVMTCGFGAYAAAAWHLVAHGLFKAWLFLRAGSNIGAQSEAAVPALASGAVPAAALIASLAGALVIAEGGAGPELLPLLLAGATALALVLTAAASRQRATLLPMLALAALGNVGGLALLTWALDRSAPALPGANAAAFALAALLLLAWARQNAGRALPAPLYARLLAA